MRHRFIEWAYAHDKILVVLAWIALWLLSKVFVP